MALLDTNGRDEDAEGEMKHSPDRHGVEFQQWLKENKLSSDDQCDLGKQFDEYELTLAEVSEYSKKDLTELATDMLNLNVIQRNRFIKGIESYKQKQKQKEQKSQSILMEEKENIQKLQQNINPKYNMSNNSDNNSMDNKKADEEKVQSNNNNNNNNNNVMQNLNKEFKFNAKVVTLGDSTVGKSSIILRFIKGEFNEYQESTIGAAFLSNNVRIVTDNDDKKKVNVKLEIWDTAGQERYHSLAPMYYRGCKGALCVYDITRRESFERAQSWINELESNGRKSDSTGIVLVGNKIDLVEETPQQRQVSKQEAQEYATNKNILFFETSAKTNENIREVFINLTKLIVDKVGDIETYCNDHGQVVDMIEHKAQQKQNGKSCC